MMRFRHTSGNAYVFLCASFLACLAVSSYAQIVPCTGTLSGTFADISVTGGTCTLDGVLVTGSITVTGGGSLVMTGASQVNGGVAATGAGDIQISGTTSVLGSVTFSNSPLNTITIGSGASVSSLSLESSGIAVVSGTVGGVSTLLSKEVRVFGGQVGGGGLLIDQGTASILLCRANIAGSISLIETTGSLVAVNSTSCASSIISGSVLVEKGSGDISLVGVSFSSGDLGVVDQNGAVLLEMAVLSDVSITSNSGPVTLRKVTSDSDVLLTSIQSKVSIVGSTLGGDTSIQQSAEIEITGSKFSFESLSVKSNNGPVTFSGNMELSVSFEENDNVQISNNMIVGASVTKNTGGVSITNNNFETLSCVDNDPAPVGSGNNVTILADGQCSSF